MRNSDKPAAYAVTVIDPNSRHAGDDSPVIIRDCGHAHRTLSGADHCLVKLTKRNPDGSWLAKWNRAHVRHADGSALSEAEADTLLDLQTRS